MSNASLILGVDGGGTKSLGLLADEFGNVLAKHTEGASNPNVVGFETAARNLHQVVLGCCSAAGCSPADIGAALFGLAGAGRQENRTRLSDGINSLFTARGDEPLPLVIDTDARIALEGAFSSEPGIIVIAGTGSVVMGKSRGGDIRSVGGWGRVLGDEGSGYFLGLEAAKAVTRDFDGTHEAGLLRRMFAERFGWNSREAIIDAVYQQKFEIPTLAPTVMEAAGGGDSVARAILENGASQLAGQVSALVRRVGGGERVGVVFIGGLIANDTVYARILQERLRHIVPQVEVRAANHPPAYGAVLMALKNLKQA